MNTENPFSGTNTTSDQEIDAVIGRNPATLTPGELAGAQPSIEVAEEAPNPFKDPLLRREAGDGWHPEGVNKKLLGAIVAREAIGSAISGAGDEEERQGILDEYRSQLEYVEGLKQELGIGEAPSRPDNQ